LSGRTEHRVRRRGGPPGAPHAIRPSGRARAQVYQRILEGISRAFASASDREEANAATARWVREAVGPGAGLRIRLVDERGELGSVFSDRIPAPDPAGRSSTKARVVRSNVPVIEAGPAGGLATAIVPLISRGELVGVLEILASGEALAEAMPSLEVVASQAAIVFRNLRRRSELDRELAMRRNALGLARELITAQSAEAAVQTVVRFCREQGDAPAAGWVSEKKDSMLMRLVAAEGLDDKRAGMMRHRLGSIPRWDLLSQRDQHRISSQFRVIADTAAGVHIDAGDVLVLAGADVPSLASVVEGFLRHALDHLATVAWADRRGKQLDLALAWTAHEFRGPLAGVKALLEQELESEESDARETMERLHAEVIHLLEIVDPVLDSAVGPAQLQRHRTNLTRLVRESITALDRPEDRDRVAVSGSQRATASVDRTLFRVAVTNLIKNAVAYSPARSEVQVSIGLDQNLAAVRVANRGPAIAPAELEIIFDPFIRGRTARRRRGGRGLGLFIARRIVEAHGGRIEVHSANDRTVFTIGLPPGDVEVVNLLDVESGLFHGRS
jgi:signal transduction histidine kinase